ncbi:MAG: insulinase family protein [Gemmatimonadaceae bacterium]|nr:insulinase family protein [Gemmatimonadaceae bacterium]MDQ3517792.1 insulinase family protein [Gemmatimonadota bacterium]
MISLPVIPHESVRRLTLANGLTVLIRRDDSAPVVAIVTYVKAGYFDESDDEVGIAHVLEHMFFKGTERRGVGEISKETKAAGGYLNAGTIYDHTSYYTVLPASSLSRGLEIQADAYSNSLIDDEELRKELEVIIQEVKRKEDSPGAVAIESLYELMHAAHRMRRWRIGREDVLRAFTRAGVNGFYRRYYQPSNTILALVGDLDPDNAQKEVQRLYRDLPNSPFTRDRGPVENGSAKFRYRELHGDIAQTQIAIGWRTPHSMHPDTPLLDLAGTVLGGGRASRLYRAVRERKLAASVSAFNYTPADTGVFVVHTEGPPESAAGAARNAWDQVRDLRQGGPERDELWRARRIFESRWVKRLETAEGQANHLAEWEAEGDWTLSDRYLERLLTAEQSLVFRAVEQYLDPDRASIVVYRPDGASPLAGDSGAMLRLLTSEKPVPLPVPAPRIAAVSGSLSTAPSLERVEGRVNVYRTNGGVPIIVRKKGGAPLVHVGVYMLGGAIDEDPGNAGLTTLLTRSAIKGTSHRAATQIAEDAELLGGSINAFTGAESFGWSISVPSANMDAAIDLLSDVAQHPTIPDAAFETERVVALADLQMLSDDMYRFPMRLMLQAAFSGHPYGVPASGTEISLPSIGANDVREWHRIRVMQSPAVIAIVGDVNPDEAATIAARSFALLRHAVAPAAPPAHWPRTAVSYDDQREKSQTAIALTFPAPARGDSGRYAARLIAGVASGLGGRFFDELRDRRSLAYSVQAFTTERRAAGIFVSYIATSPEKEDVAREGLLREFAKLRAEPVSEAELSRAQEYAIGTYAIHQSSGAAVLGDLVDAWLFGELIELEVHEARIRAVTAAQMLEVAERHFDESRVVQGIVRGR